MKVFQILTRSVLVFIIQITSCQEKEIEIKVQGVVSDIQSDKYTPIDSAEITLSELERPYLTFLTKTTTDAQGFYLLTYNIEGEYHQLSIGVSKPGYYPSSQETVRVTENLQTIDLKLQRKSAEKDSFEVNAF